MSLRGPQPWVTELTILVIFVVVGTFIFDTFFFPWSWVPGVLAFSFVVYRWMWEVMW